MKTRAAVAWKAGAPLTIETVDLQGPRAGEVLVEVKATGRKWKGSAFGGARGRTDVPKIGDWYMEGKIQIDPPITHTLKLEDINHGFELMERGESIRSVVLF